MQSSSRFTPRFVFASKGGEGGRRGGARFSDMFCKWVHSEDVSCVEKKKKKTKYYISAHSLISCHSVCSISLFVANFFQCWSCDVLLFDWVSNGQLGQEASGRKDLNISHTNSLWTIMLKCCEVQKHDPDQGLMKASSGRKSVIYIAMNWNRNQKAYNPFVLFTFAHKYTQNTLHTNTDTKPALLFAVLRFICKEEKNSRTLLYYYIFYFKSCLKIRFW